MKKKLSVVSLIVTNLFLLGGVLFFDWDISNIMFLYWFENIVIGFYNILKMVKSEKANNHGVTITTPGRSVADRSKKATILFFIMHYGTFTAAHGVFVFAFFPGNYADKETLLLGILSLLVSHGISYLTNYVGKKEHLSLSPEELMLAPYRRVIVMHLTIIFGGMFIVKINGESFGPLIVLSLVKTFIDLFSHNFEHNKLIPNVMQSYPTKVYKIPGGMVKKFFPGFENYAEDAYKKSVESGKWDEIKTTMDPGTVNYIESYWSEKTRQ